MVGRRPWLSEQLFYSTPQGYQVHHKPVQDEMAKYRVPLVLLPMEFATPLTASHFPMTCIGMST